MNIELYRGGHSYPTTLQPFYHAQGQLPFNLAWFTSDYALAECYGPVNDYELTLHNIKEVTREEWSAFDRVLLFVNPQPVIDLKAQGYDAVRCQFTSEVSAVLVLGVSLGNCKDNGGAHPPDSEECGEE
tara:strand:+ start:92 stop:478 length:387 start_codon:yes stop_codon:yes gene_type:complete